MSVEKQKLTNNNKNCSFYISKCTYMYSQSKYSKHPAYFPGIYYFRFNTHRRPYANIIVVKLWASLLSIRDVNEKLLNPRNSARHKLHGMIISYSYELQHSPELFIFVRNGYRSQLIHTIYYAALKTRTFDSVKTSQDSIKYVTHSLFSP